MSPGVTNCFPDQPRPAVIQIPAVDPNGAKRSVACMFQGMHGKRLTLEAAESIPTSKLISVEYDDTMFLGEVVTCVAAQNTWSVEVKVEQVLNGLQSLLALRSRLLSEGVPLPAGGPRAEAVNESLVASRASLNP